ncbi:ABC transporter substrate-binding protein [Phenylobacterium sp.]|uniref:ABC transporter substrate-binding protein n=1 Tax=Phenylobacterium sp. TaxID=1871053 RepID=UPI002BC3B590|nr:ABC transporter substrate-binding protein [Phenylobacterium sp.]HVI30812.1 ABC transporter substrate-binding protein [Phenylobacterium sp.]
MRPPGADAGHPGRPAARPRRRLSLLALALGLAAAPAAQAAPRVLAFDQCADQYVLALSPRAAIAGLSTRADDADSRLRSLAAGLPRRRVDLETALAARPDVVVRYWGGDPRLIRRLEDRGVRVVTIDEATDFPGLRANIRKVAAALQQPARGEALVARLDAQLARAAGAWNGTRVLYLTPSGVTAGPGALVDAVLRAAGLANAETRPGYHTVSLEALVLDPPERVVLGFFDTFQLAGDSWGPGRHRVLRRVAAERAIASVPGSMLACPDWGAGDAVELLASKAPR